MKLALDVDPSEATNSVLLSDQSPPIKRTPEPAAQHRWSLLSSTSTTGLAKKVAVVVSQVRQDLLVPYPPHRRPPHSE